MSFLAPRLSAALLSLALLSPATAGGAEGAGVARPLMPDFAATPPWPVDCDPPMNRTDGCRLRVALPVGIPLPAPGELKIVPGTDRLTVLYRPPGAAREVTMCCGVYLPLAPIPGTGVWAVTAQIKDLAHAILSLRVDVAGLPSPAQANTVWRGPQAPTAISRTRVLSGKIDRFVLKSGNSLVGTREITVYTPPNWTKAERLPAVYLGDGGMVLGLARSLEPALAKGGAPRVILVGIESARPTYGEAYTREGDLRAQEYLEGWEGGRARFEAHEQFVLTAVLPHVERAYHLSPSPQDRVVGGASNGGAWAISMAARHPDVFRGVLAMSPSNAGLQNAPHPAARVFASGGTLELPFLEAARQYTALARGAGRPTRLVTLVGGHDAFLWEEIFPAGVTFTLER
ncbi:alpha/beta hydrolase [Deinococcus hopiensis]|uniref:Enterochelin esterase n=1 Tax=Deinococcus hopiensis KR-140 TaxID=695939 RepID=A0A1W1UVL5_9DEIO|nr:alpha/beta hydrolase-fold protein [Deinococcus hopiensis]SMB85090.1 Enterochelin esterase [Deinococcus hopiensis KR-140]